MNIKQRATLLLVGCIFFPICLCAQDLPITQKQYWVTTWDGYRLDVDVFAPKTGSSYPLVIFSPSWDFNKIEYLIPAATMARHGYITVSYTARGWFNATGTINLAEADDMRDITSIIDFVLGRYPQADIQRIGMCGISLGALRSMRAPLFDARIRTAVAMSSVADMGTAMYKQNSPNNEWLTSAMNSSLLADTTRALRDGRDIPGILNWLASFSPLNDLTFYNALTHPVSMYLINCYDDELFEPNPLMDFYQRVSMNEKVMDLGDGSHTFPAGFGCLGLPEPGWTKTYQWFDWHLKGIPSSISSRIQNTPVSMQLLGTKERLYFSGWPAAPIWNVDYYLQPRPREYAWQWQKREAGWTLVRVLKTVGFAGRLGDQASASRETERVESGPGSAAITGTSNIVAKMANTRVTTKIAALDTAHAIVYETPAFPASRILAGIPRLRLSVSPSAPDAQVIAHLYDVDPQGTGTLLTHSIWTLRDVTPGARIRLDFEFHAVACRIEKGHSLALVIDAHDPRYAFPKRDDYTVVLHADDAPVLTIPYTWAKPVTEVLP